MPDLKTMLRADTKALPAADFFAPGGAPITTYVPGGQNQRQRSLLSQREAPLHSQAYGGEQAIDILYSGINLYADTTGLAPYHFQKNGERYYSPNDPRRPDGAKIVDQRLARLIDQPNPFMDYTELIQLMVIDLLLVGNAYWLKWRNNAQGQPLALYRMSPMHVKVVRGDYGIEGYEYQPEGVKDPIKLSVQDVVHYKRPNPNSIYYGLGIVKGGGRPFDLELALTDATASYFENKADPSLIVQSERRVPRDVFHKLRAQLRQRVSGTNRAGELLVLEAGLKASTLTPNARDAMYAELSEASRSRVLSLLRLHPSLLGFPTSSAETNKVEAIRREFDNKTMRPFLDRIQTLVTNKVTEAYGYSFHIDYRYTMPQEEAVKLSGDFGSVPGVKVIEVRQFLVDAGVIRDASTGDKEIDEMVLNLPGEELDANGQGGFADRPLPREAGRPPKGENTLAFPKGGGALPAGAKVRKTASTKALTMDDIERRLQLAIDEKAIKNDDNVNIVVGNKLTGEKRPKDLLAPQRSREIDAIAASFKRELADAVGPLERALLDNVEGKAGTETLLQRLRKNEAWKTFQATIAGVMERYAQQGLSSAVIHAESDAEIDYEAVARGLVYRKDGVRSITQTLKDEVVAKVGRALKEGDDRKAFDAAVRESIDFWRETKAETIALTEAVHAYNEGTLLSLEARGDKTVFVEDGHDHDEPCAEADGSVWYIDYAREHRLEHPRCRRAFLPVPA